MFTAALLVVGAIVVWLVADQGLLWLRERQQRGGSAWRGHGPGSTFHSSGFEDTLPPHEVVDPVRRVESRLP
jgi:hypothetical protein